MRRMLRNCNKMSFFGNHVCISRCRVFELTRLHKDVHIPGGETRRNPKGSSSLRGCIKKNRSTSRVKKMQNSVLYPKSFDHLSSLIPSVAIASPPATSKKMNSFTEDVAMKLLHERAKWFGRIIPEVSLVTLNTLLDMSRGHHLPEKGNLLVLDNWDEFVDRTGASFKEKQFLTSKETIYAIVKAMRDFLSQERKRVGSLTQENVTHLPLLVLIPSLLDPVTARNEQLILEQAILMDKECTDLKLHRLATLWVMNREESLRWRKELKDGAVSVTWPLRTPPHTCSTLRRIQQPPLIPDSKLHHIIARVDLQDVNAVFTSSPDMVLPCIGHLLLLREPTSSRDLSTSNREGSSLSHTNAGNTAASSPTEKVMVLMPIIEKAIGDYIIALKSSSSSSYEHPMRINGKYPDVLPLTLLVLSFLSSSEAKDLQRLLHYSVRMTLMAHKKHFVADPVVWVLTEEQKEKLTLAYHSDRVGKQWTDASLSEQYSQDSTSGLASIAMGTHFNFPSAHGTAGSDEKEGLSSQVFKSNMISNSAESLVISTPHSSLSESLGSPVLSLQRNIKDTSMKENPRPWISPQDSLIGGNGKSGSNLPSELGSHGEIEILWSSAPGFSISVDSLKSLLSREVFVKVQHLLRNTLWKPPCLHVLACHAGAEQLEQNTAVMFQDLMNTAADYFECITGEKTLLDALHGHPSHHNMAVDGKKSLEDREEELDEMREKIRGEKKVVSCSSSTTFSDTLSTNGDVDLELKEKSSARFVKITILLYTDLRVQSEVNLLRVLLRNLYDQLPELVQNFIIALEVMDVGAHSAAEALERLKASELNRDFSVPQKQKEFIDLNDATVGASTGALLCPPPTGTLEHDGSSTSFQPEAFAEAHHQQHLRQEGQHPQKFRSFLTSSTQNAEVILTSKTELKNLLKDAVEEVTDRHEQVVSHLVNSLSKVVGVWTSESFMQQFAAVIRQDIKPLQEHLLESAAASAKYQREMTMSEDVGKELLRKLDGFISILSSPTAADVPVAETDVAAKVDAVISAASIHPFLPLDKPVLSKREKEKSSEDNSLNPLEKGIPIHDQDPLDTVALENEKSPTTPPQSFLKMSPSEVRFLNRVAKKVLKQRKLKSSKVAAKTWLSAEKRLLSNNPDRCYQVIFSRSPEVKDEDDPESELHEALVKLTESAYLLGKPRSRRALKNHDVHKRSQLLKNYSREKKIIQRVVKVNRSPRYATTNTTNRTSTVGNIASLFQKKTDLPRKSKINFQKFHVNRLPIRRTKKKKNYSRRMKK